MSVKKGKDYQLRALLSRLFSDVAGESAVALVDLLFGKKPVNEFLIAKKMKLTINQVRNLLYRLGDDRLVSFTRKKDAKKGGWYTYFWVIEVEKCLEKMQERFERKRDTLRERVKKMQVHQFYRCELCSLDFTEEEALLKDFHCSECGELMVLKDTSLEVEQFEAELLGVQELLDPLAEELQVLRQKASKARARADALETKKKALERKKRATVRKRLRTLEKKKEAKKKEKSVKEKGKKVARKATKKKGKGKAKRSR